MLEDNDIHFAVEEDRADSQIVFSDSAASCWMNQFAKSRIGTIVVDDVTVNEFWQNDDVTYKFDTSSLQEHFPVLEHKIGPNKPLEIELTFKDITVEFAKANSDIQMNMTLGFNVSYYEGEGDLKVLRHAIYDENPVTTTLNAFIDQDFFYFALLEVKL